MAKPKNIFDIANAYRNAGLSVIPIKGDGSKAPAKDLLPNGRWKCYQHRKPTEAELRDWFDAHGGMPPRVGIAVIGGQVSGNLEVLDVDSWEYVKPWRDLVKKQAPGLLKRLVMVRSPRPGLHVYYRCEEIAGCMKLAQISSQDSETGEIVPKTILETKGEGGYVLAPGCPPECHPTGRCYEFINDKNEWMIPTITADERTVLLDAARAQNSWHDPNELRRVERQARSAAGPIGGRPGDDFNVNGDWAEILEPHGWTFLYKGKDGTEYWRRPGKNSGGSSATVNHDGSDLFYVFSSNAFPFEPEQAYPKFSAYTLLEWDGDFSAAATALAVDGYGKRLPSRFRKRKSSKGSFARYAGFNPPPGWKK